MRDCRMTDRRKPTGLWLTFAALLCLAGPARAQEDVVPTPPKPDPAKVAAELAEAVGVLWTRARQEKPILEGTASEVENYLIIEDLRMLKRHTEMLSQRLARGEGPERTEPLFWRIQVLVAQARTLRAHTSILQGSEAEIAEANRLLDALTSHFEGETPPVGTPKGSEKE